MYIPLYYIYILLNIPYIFLELRRYCIFLECLELHGGGAVQLGKLYQERIKDRNSTRDWYIGVQEE